MGRGGGAESVRCAFAGGKIPPYPYRILESVAGECFQSFASVSNPGNKIGLAAGGEGRANRIGHRGTEPTEMKKLIECRLLLASARYIGACKYRRPVNLAAHKNGPW